MPSTFYQKKRTKVQRLLRTYGGLVTLRRRVDQPPPDPDRPWIVGSSLVVDQTIFAVRIPASDPSNLFDDLYIQPLDSADNEIDPREDDQVIFADGSTWSIVKPPQRFDPSSGCVVLWVAQVKQWPQTS
jgi:hypothetical protein